jgi:Na+-translocating ferredoxin:NAD+ oxidoreductase subunit D
MSNLFKVTASPHLHERINTRSVMWDVVIALIPAVIASVIFFGFRALFLTLCGVAAAVLAEAAVQKWRRKPITVSDGSAVVTGILVAFNLNSGPADAGFFSYWWLPVVGSVFAIVVGKQVFGGLGNNPFNPALLARAFLVASWPTLTTSGWVPTLKHSINGLHLGELPPEVINHPIITGATPLGVAKALRDTTQFAFPAPVRDNVLNHLANMNTISNLFWGNCGGVIGEVSAFALLIGAAYLLYKNIIEWRIPVSFIGTVFVLSFLFGGLHGLCSASLLLPVFHIFAGGLILGAFFMATDMVTSPVTKHGRIIFGIGCGLITIVIRLWGGYPEGVCYSILIMNIFVPLIDKFTMPKAFGEVKK